MSQVKIVHESLNQESIQTQNEGLVLLFPVTRVGAIAEIKWRQIVDLCNRSQISSLVVIDKTPNMAATRFFTSQSFQQNHEIWILNRPSTEAIYDSQKFIQLRGNSWIIQLHDDDEWEGKLQLDGASHELTAFQILFHVGSKVEHAKNADYDNLPARVNFTLLPTQIWNRFTAFIESQSGHVAGSVDATLNMIVRDVCFLSNNIEFKYYYNIRHWRNDRAGKGHLTELSREDGWENYSSPEIAVLNRTIDNLAALSYFKDFYDEKKLLSSISRELSSFKLHFMKKMFLYYKLILSKWGYKKNRTELLTKLITASNITTMSDLILWLENLPHLNFIEARRKFWVGAVGELEALSRH